MGIKSIIPSQVLNSRGEPTVKVEMTAENGKSANFVVPGGASVGKYEAVKKFDGNDNTYGGKSVYENVETINRVIAPKFIGYPLDHQEDFDSLLIALDGSANKENLGSNTILALSGAYFKLSAKLSKKPLWQYIAEKLKTSPEFPRIFANLVGGGKHAPGLDIQEFLVVPQSKEPSKAIEQIVQTYQTVRTIMTSLYGPTAKLSGDEGAIAPLGARTEVVLEALSNLSQKSENKFDIALDVAANSFYDGKNYNFEGQSVHASDLMKIYQDWSSKFKLFSIEDPFAETDLEGIELLKTMPKDKNTFLVIGDDFTVTNASKIEEFAANKIIDGVIIKPDQVGSITEMLSAIMATKKAGLKIIVSHRSGDTNDSFIADLAYGAGADGIKIGAPNRGERIAKYNRLLDIENSLESNQQYSAQTEQVPVFNQPENVLQDSAPSPESNMANTGQDNSISANTQAPSPIQSRDIHFGIQTPASITASSTEDKFSQNRSAETNHNENTNTHSEATPTPKELPDINDIRINPPSNPIPIVPQDGQNEISSLKSAAQDLNPTSRTNEDKDNKPRPALST